MNNRPSASGACVSGVLTRIARIGAALSFALTVAGWVFGVFAYWRLERTFILVAVVGNSLLVLFIVLWVFSLWGGGEMGWSSQPPIE